jgi:hypothetical protein
VGYTLRASASVVATTCLTKTLTHTVHLLFSSRYVLMAAPEMALLALKWIWMSLPKRLLLWLRSVLALPNASKMGFVSST